VERRARLGQRRALIKVGYSCNDHCVFCHTDDYRHSGDADTSSVQRKIDLAWAKGYDMVVLSGGEATMRPDLFQLARHVQGRGMLLGFITNGRVMSYQHVVRKLLAFNLRYVHLSLHGTERVHNKLTGDRSFEQTFTGLKNLAGLGLDLTANCVVTAQNLGDLRALVDLLRPFPDVLVKFSCCEPKGAALRNASAVVPPLEDAARAVVDAIRYGQAPENGAPVRFAVENFPFCQLDGLHELDDDLAANRLVSMSEVWDADLVDIDDFNKLKPPACSGCAHWDSCPGLFVEEVRQRGDAVAKRVVAPQGSVEGSAFGVPLSGLVEMAPGFRPPEQARVDCHPRYPDTALITLMVPECDQRCVFCSAPPPRAPVRFSTLGGVSAALRAMAPHCSAVVFTGGEPTRLPWMIEALRVARAEGYATVQLQTHAGAFASPKLAAEWVKAGLTAVDVPLYGGAAAVHEGITNTPRSFQRALAGVANLRSHGAKLVLHNTLFRANTPALPQWFSKVRELAPDGAYVQITRDVGPPGTYAASVPPMAGVVRELEPLCSTLPPTVALRVMDVPVCGSGGLSPWLAAGMAPVRNPEFVLLGYSEWLDAFSGAPLGMSAGECSACTARRRCAGVAPEALLHMPELSLRPLSGDADGAI
jgi:MoaA/NifB/PqqE/SkfB family radical SAM enzyme